MRQLAWNLALVVLVLVGCAAPGAPTTGPTEQAGATRTPKRVSAVVVNEFSGVINRITGRFGPGTGEVETMVSAGLVILDEGGIAHAQLAETVPSTDNGLWRIFADGTMETTWRLRDGLAWHDGAPFTTGDVVFTLNAARHPDLRGFFGTPGYDTIESVEAPDPRTVVLRWKGPYIYADRILSLPGSSSFTGPLPRHLLEDRITQDPSGLRDLSYWVEDYVGTGAYRLKEWTIGSHFKLEAFDRFARGRPKIDELTIWFVPDVNAAVLRLLSGQAEFQLGGGVSLAQAAEAATHWPDGKMDSGLVNWNMIFPQFVNPSPPIIANTQFRRALMYAIDRQQMVDIFLNGLSSVAHSWLDPRAPEYPYVEGRLMRYAYNPQRAAQELAALGFTTGADGLLRGPGGEPLAEIELRSSDEQELTQTTLAVQNNWRQVGVRTKVDVMPRQLSQDREHRATKPAFEVSAGTNALVNLANMHSRTIPLPENSFRGNNFSRHADPELDRLIDRYYLTVPRGDQVELLAQIMQRSSEELNIMGLYYKLEVSLIGNRLVNVRARPSTNTNQAWNVQDWDVNAAG